MTKLEEVTIYLKKLEKEIGHEGEIDDDIDLQATLAEACFSGKDILELRALIKRLEE